MNIDNLSEDWEGAVPTREEIAEMLSGLVLLGYVEITGVDEDGNFLYSATSKTTETPIERIIGDLGGYFAEDGALGDI